jgi:hypothetical protein
MFDVSVSELNRTHLKYLMCFKTVPHYLFMGYCKIIEAFQVTKVRSLYFPLYVIREDNIVYICNLKVSFLLYSVVNMYSISEIIIMIFGKKHMCIICLNNVICFQSHYTV